MTPQRRRAVLPAGHWWIANQCHGRLVITLSAAVPVNSDLETELVRQATTAWRRHQRRGLALAPVPVAAGGLGWLAKQIRQPAVAGATAAVAAAAAVTGLAITTSPDRPHVRPPAAEAPAPPSPTRPGAPQPGPGRPSHAAPRAPVTTPAARRPMSVLPVSRTVPPATAPVHVPAVPHARPHVPVVRVPRPPVVVPRVPRDPVPVPPVVVPAQFRLLEAKVGRLVRIRI